MKNAACKTWELSAVPTPSRRTSTTVAKWLDFHTVVRRQTPNDYLRRIQVRHVLGQDVLRRIRRRIPSCQPEVRAGASTAAVNPVLRQSSEVNHPVILGVKQTCAAWPSKDKAARLGNRTLARRELPIAAAVGQKKSTETHFRYASWRKDRRGAAAFACLQDSPRRS